MPFTFQEVGDVLELGYVVLTETAVINQQREHVVKLTARMCLVQLGERFEDGAPKQR